MNKLFTYSTSILLLFLSLSNLSSCKQKGEDKKDEQIRFSDYDERNASDTGINSIIGNITMEQIATKPSSIVLTGLSKHRLVPIYKAKEETKETSNYIITGSWMGDDEGGYSEIEEHFMPGIDVLFGYKLLNLSHYDFTKEKSNFFFTHPVFIKTVYFPAIEQDSINKKPINRNYYLVSVYDEDTNKDTVLNRRDLRRFYHFDSTAVVKTALIPTDYSVIRSQYDYQNDLMYIYARQDKNKNGSSESNEPIHIFWFSLKTPAVAKRTYWFENINNTKLKTKTWFKVNHGDTENTEFHGGIS